MFLVHVGFVQQRDAGHILLSVQARLLLAQLGRRRSGAVHAVQPWQLLLHRRPRRMPAGAARTVQQLIRYSPRQIFMLPVDIQLTPSFVWFHLQARHRARCVLPAPLPLRLARLCARFVRPVSSARCLAQSAVHSVPLASPARSPVRPAAPSARKAASS